MSNENETLNCTQAPESGAAATPVCVQTVNHGQRLSGWRIRIRLNDQPMEIGTSDVDERKYQFVGFLEQQTRDVPLACSLTLGDAAKNANHLARINGRAPSKAHDNHLIPFFGAETKMSTITTPWIKQFVEHQLNAGAANATVNRQLEALRRAFTVAVQDQLLLSKPYIPRLKEHNVRTGFFERKQFEAVRRNLARAGRALTDAETESESVVAIVECGWITGWRLGEIRALRWNNVDFVNAVVRLEPGTTKNGEGREFPMTKALRAVLERRLKRLKGDRDVSVAVDSAEFVFTKANGKPVGEFRKAWHRACRLAGIPDRVVRKKKRTGQVIERRLPGLTFHDFRRTAVRRLVEEAGVSERVAMTMTGHKTRAVFDRYHIVSQRDQREAARRLDELDAAADGRLGVASSR